MSNQSNLLWQDPLWLAQAKAWIHAQAKDQSIRISGEIEQPHAYPWSTVLRVPTDAGTLFFKATAPETRYEAELTEMMAVWNPDCMPELLAVDTLRGWMLMRDGGELLRAAIRPKQDIAPWAPVITRYAELQLDLAQRVPELLTLGVPDYRLARLPRLYLPLLADQESLGLNQPDGLGSNEVDHLRELAPRFEQICTELAAFEIPESLNHGDFHDGNILLRDGRITFFDWGDANLTHPFVSLRTFFVSIEISLKLDDFSFTPEMAGLLERYLEPWQQFASQEALLTAYRLSRPVASVAKALAWHKTISNLKAPLREKYAGIVPELMKEFLVYEKMASA
ncbi:MAG TPA: phosphotransferase [Anaerolineales bacterium]|nr:phosphotransferase [Anaerolineales bacterium]HLO29098.1 phosphotransferase [Anaerolineales bacterium]